MLRTWLRHRRRGHTRPTRQPAAPRPLVERLEDRCLLNAGTLDPFFGFLGKSVTLNIASAADAASATAFQPDGKLLVAGTSVYGDASNPVQSAFAVARYNTNGTLDWTFGLGGRATAYFGENLTGPAAFSLAQANAVAVQPDGKILVAGVQSSGNPAFALARFNANGTPDTTFGVGGEEITYFPDFFTSPPTAATSIALLPGGKFLVAGQAGFGGASEFALAQYNADGSLDTTFGGGTGEVTTQVLPGATEGANAISVQSNGAIVLAGWVQPSGTSAEFALVRYTAAGTLDTSFNGTGKVVTNLGGLEYAFAVTITSAGKIRVAGDSAGSSGTQSVGLAQYNANGSLDTTFGSGGTVTAPFAFTFPESGGSVQGGAGVSFTPDGKVVVVGATAASGSDFGVERYNANGTVDTTFGTHGTVTTDLGGTDTATAVAVKADGTLAAAGDTTSNNGDFAVARYRSNGSLLTSFAGGKVTTNFFFSTVAPTDPVFFPASSGFTAVLPDGDLLVAGTVAPDGIDGEFILAKYTSFGLPDLSFGHLGTVVTSFGPGTSASAAGIAVAPNGTIYVVGSVINPATTTEGDIAVAAYNANGSPDTAFNGTGTLAIDFNGMNDTGAGIAVQPDGNVVVVGTTTDPSTFDQDFALARVTPGGAFDPNFGAGGEVITDFGGAQAAGVVLSGGQILVVGTALGQMAVARYNADGSLDGNFGAGGLATAVFEFGSTGSSVAVAPNGQIVVGGSTPDPVTFNNDFALARFNTDGSPDTNFGGTGETSFTFDGGFDNGASVTVQADGKILIAGTATPPFDPSQPTTANSVFALARVNTDGSLDNTFGTGGEVTTSFDGDAAVAASVVLTPTGNIIVGGSVYGNGGGALALACYLGDNGDPFNF